MVPGTTQFNLQEFDFAYPPGIENHYWQRGRNFLLMKAIRDAGLQNESILEIGCGKGHVVATLRNNNISCWGAELADVASVDAAAAYVKSNMDAALMEVAFRNQITVLMFLDVIEHIEDPVLFLKGMLAPYPNVRHLIISVPARQEIWSSYDTFYRHFRRYDPGLLRQTVQALNFRIDNWFYFFHFLYWAARLRSMFSGKRPVILHAPRGIHKFFHRMIAHLLIWESQALPRKSPGSSLLCVASKNI